MLNWEENLEKKLINIRAKNIKKKEKELEKIKIQNKKHKKHKKPKKSKKEIKQLKKYKKIYYRERYLRLTKDKREAKKLEKIKKYKEIRNERKRLKRKKFHENIGDRYGYFQVIIVRNGKRIKKLKIFRWISNAYNFYNNQIAQNRNNIATYQTNTRMTNKSSNDKEMKKESHYEIILIEHYDKSKSDGIRRFKDENGKYINTIVDNSNYIILNKDIWFIEETYHVYGYHPEKDRKTGMWIFENLIVPNNNKYNIKRIFLYNNKLFIQYDDDFDFIITKNKDDAKLLYKNLERLSYKLKYVLYTGDIKNINKGRIIKKMMEKTGWGESACKRSKL